MMNWDQLLSAHRFSKTEDGRPAEPPTTDPFRSPFEADYDRVVYSTPFRRLARKTQVHPLALNDHVHTRLTHSLEVASVGRSLARRLAKFLEQRNEMPETIDGHDLAWIAQSACLAHDIGNPPFGHAGEFAVREWVDDHQDIVFGDQIGAENVALRNDFLIFEGNAQGFRLAARGDNPETGYMRLTFATLGAMIKYPWDSSDVRAVNKRKFNVYSTELEHFHLLVEEMSMRSASGTPARHPLSFLTEAADDICYRILDLEDAVEMRIVPEQRVRSVFVSMCSIAPNEAASLAEIRGQAIRALIEDAWKVFESDYQNIMNGSRQDDLKSGFSAPLAESLDRVSSLYTEIFADRTKVAAELGAYKALGRILRALCDAVRELATTEKDYEKMGFISRRCLELAWSSEYAKSHKDKPFDWWLHQVMDYVSGLTDRYARRLSGEIAGT